MEVLISLLGKSQSLDLIKKIRQSETLFPFFGHCDTSLVEDTDNFKIKL